MTTRRITVADLRHFRGLTKDAVAELILRQPKTVAEAICIPRVGRKTARLLVDAGLLADPDDMVQPAPRIDSAAEWNGADDAAVVDFRAGDQKLPARSLPRGLGYDDRPEVVALLRNLREQLRR